ncbi:MAG: alginate export family protein [Candidatus Binatia bacterium]
MAIFSRTHRAMTFVVTVTAAALLAGTVAAGEPITIAGAATPAEEAPESAPIAGMDAAPPPDKFKIAATWRTRLEMWDFFEPSGAGGANNTYNFLGNDLRVSAAWTDDWFDVFVEGQSVILAELPSHAVGTSAEGPLGLGAVYRANNNDDDFDASGYLRQASLKLKKLGVRGLSLKGGRQVFSDGKEAIPADPTLAWLQNTRIAERLIGPFDFSYAGRSFDSALVNYTHGALNVTGFYGKPTQGGFNINGMDQIDEIDLAYGSVNLNHPEFAGNTAARLFYIYYADDRALLKVDNRPLDERQADTGNIGIHTIGGDVLQLVPTGIGPIDLLGWFAYQAGEWGVQDHSAWSLAIEAGIQPADLPWKPWIRAGFNMGSGDDNAGDGDHESFFQVLPTPRLYSLSTFYNLMNSEDIFAQVIVKPMAGLVWRTDFHVLRLSEDDDLWYFGGGATREKRNAGFGFGGRPSSGKNSLMEVLETQVSYNWNDYIATTVYYGHGFGEDVVEAGFSGKSANFGFLEVTLKLPPM